MTRQLKDVLIFEGKNYQLTTYILDSYIRKHASLKNTSSGMTALYRGYIATFMITNDCLYIHKLETLSTARRLHFTSILHENFPNSKQCTWFSGLLRIDDSKGDFNEEKETMIFEFLEIYKGHFIGKRTMNYQELQEFKIKQYAKFKETEAYTKLYRNLMNGYQDASKVEALIMKRILQFITEVV